jgi:hypothetical protein
MKNFSSFKIIIISDIKLISEFNYLNILFYTFNFAKLFPFQGLWSVEDCSDSKIYFNKKFQNSVLGEFLGEFP